MTRESLGLRTGSYGSLQQQTSQLLARKTSKMLLSSTREKERFLVFFCRYFGRKKVAMLLLLVLALIVFVFGSFTISKENTTVNTTQLENMPAYEHTLLKDSRSPFFPVKVKNRSQRHLLPSDHASAVRISPHPCENFTIPPPPPTLRKLIGPRPCPVCYIPAEEALASMPSLPSESPVIQQLTYARDENPTTSESHQGSDFGGYPSLKQRNDYFDIKESMSVHCGFVKGNKPGQQSGFDIDEDDLMELEKFHDVIVASAIFGNYDLIQHPKKISEAARKNVPFFMFIDEETEAYMTNSSLLNGTKKVGLWRIVVVHNVPYADPRRNGKVPKLLLHRLFPNIRFSIWIDGKLELVVDPYKILERFLWRQNATFAISRHYKRFDVFEEAEANKAAGKYSNSSIDEQIDFYVTEGLTPYSTAKLPITSDVPEGCVIIREHIPITNLFTCLWFNEVDRFTSRDQLSFSTVRDKIMARVGWSVNMFLDCERRNFVIQSYHRELLENMPPPPPPVIRFLPPALHASNISVKTPTVKKNPPKRGRGDKKPGSRRHRKVVAGSRRDKIPF